VLLRFVRHQGFSSAAVCVICVAGLPAHLRVKAQDFLTPKERAQGFRFSREIWFTASSFFFQLSGLLGFRHRVQRPCAPGLGFVCLIKMVLFAAVGALDSF
jgi:hypothetical protein